jgi:hypothetical protein
MLIPAAKLEAMTSAVIFAGENIWVNCTRGVWVKKETHAARWGLMRGYSVKATKWVDFVMTDSTRRESCHLLNVTGDGVEVK